MIISLFHFISFIHQHADMMRLHAASDIRLQRCENGSFIELNMEVSIATVAAMPLKVTVRGAFGCLEQEPGGNAWGLVLWRCRARCDFACID